MTFCTSDDAINIVALFVPDWKDQTTNSDLNSLVDAIVIEASDDVRTFVGSKYDLTDIESIPIPPQIQYLTCLIAGQMIITRAGFLNPDMIRPFLEWIIEEIKEKKIKIMGGFLLDSTNTPVSTITPVRTYEGIDMESSPGDAFNNGRKL